MAVSGNHSSRVFEVTSGVSVDIHDLTITDGRETAATATGPLGPITLGGGILNNGGHLMVSHVTLANNQVVGINGGGGAIANVFGATLTVDHGTFTGNQATGSAGGTSGGPPAEGS